MYSFGISLPNSTWLTGRPELNTAHRNIMMDKTGLGVSGTFRLELGELCWRSCKIWVNIPESIKIENFFCFTGEWGKSYTICMPVICYNRGQISWDTLLSWFRLIPPSHNGLRWKVPFKCCSNRCYVKVRVVWGGGGIENSITAKIFPKNCP